jgi:hypothetical protein
MRASSKAVVVAATLIVGLLASVFSATPAAADRTITLYGTRAGGWGFSNTTITSPGPHLEIVQGEMVTLFLTSADQDPHDWFIDYNLDSSSGGNEPQLPGTFDENTRNWTFSANRNGTFVYRGEGADGEKMWGLITIHPPGTTVPGGGGGGGADPTSLAIVGVVIAVVVMFALYYFVIRKGVRPRAPPPPPEE